MCNHKSAYLLNTSCQDADVEIIVYFSNREPAGPYLISIAAQQTRLVNFSDLTHLDLHPLATDYVSIIKSNAPVLVQQIEVEGWQQDPCKLVKEDLKALVRMIWQAFLPD